MYVRASIVLGHGEKMGYTPLAVKAGRINEFVKNA